VNLVPSERAFEQLNANSSQDFEVHTFIEQ